MLANNRLVIVSLASAANAQGWKPCVWTTSGNEALQAVSSHYTLNPAGNAWAFGSSWMEPTTGVASFFGVSAAIGEALYSHRADCSPVA